MRLVHSIVAYHNPSYCQQDAFKKVKFSLCRDAAGEPLPEQTLDACKASDAVLLAAIGG